ncbi:MAG TPA: hypothetical protein VNW71_23305, partial [Thermoanaerobaculia bacterium]|nr:hypothetical protein [Thermoanaerobaculia bacterium]
MDEDAGELVVLLERHERLGGPVEQVQGRLHLPEIAAHHRFQQVDARREVRIGPAALLVQP